MGLMKSIYTTCNACGEYGDGCLNCTMVIRGVKVRAKAVKEFRNTKSYQRSDVGYIGNDLFALPQGR